ncbi:MAG TPA: hypothetical protein VN950_13005 [Terriglobales bacterium]|nr:hypothetical protein [Terriglobales bacterium]
MDVKAAIAEQSQHFWLYDPSVPENHNRDFAPTKSILAIRAVYVFDYV